LAGSVALVAPQIENIGQFVEATSSLGYGSGPVVDHIDEDVVVMARLMSANLKSGFSALMEHRKQQ
jgi:hypothetical protein